MANENKLFKRCEACCGDGVITQLSTIQSPPFTQTWIEVTCSRCLGSGVLPSGQMVLPSGYFLARDVFACMNYFEWADLDDQPKELLALVLSLGTLNLSEGSAELLTLRVIFPVGKLTRTALEVLIA